MNAKPIPRKEMVLIALMFPILGILFGGIYSYPAGRLTKERDPWFTLLLAAGLACTVFGLGYAVHTSPAHLGMVWVASVVLLLLVRAAFGLRGTFEHFGMVHMATLLILFAVLVFTRLPRPTSPNHALQRTVPAVPE
jgi:nitrate reductase gamma subunit